jgi:fructose-1-phosphate kinase PfkB-like protein
MTEFDPTIRDRFAARALDTLAQLDADPEANSLTRQVAVTDAIDDAIAAGVAHFQASVAAGSLPRALPHDAACNVIVALKNAGFKVVRDRSKK